MLAKRRRRRGLIRLECGLGIAADEGEDVYQQDDRGGAGQQHNKPVRHKSDGVSFEIGWPRPQIATEDAR